MCLGQSSVVFSVFKVNSEILYHIFKDGGNARWTGILGQQLNTFRVLERKKYFSEKHRFLWLVNSVQLSKVEKQLPFSLPVKHAFCWSVLSCFNMNLISLPVEKDFLYRLSIWICVPNQLRAQLSWNFENELKNFTVFLVWLIQISSRLPLKHQWCLKPNW